MNIWKIFMGKNTPKNKVSTQKEYRKILSMKLSNKHFSDLSDEDKRVVLEVAAKDFSSKFSKDLAILAKE